MPNNKVDAFFTHSDYYCCILNFLRFTIAFKARVFWSLSSVQYVRFQVLTAESMKFRIVFWDVLPCKMIVDRRFRGMCCLHQRVSSSLMMEAARTSETSVYNYFTWQYIPEDNSELQVYNAFTLVTLRIRFLLGRYNSNAVLILEVLVSQCLEVYMSLIL
jgi:hypothetical protein